MRNFLLDEQPNFSESVTIVNHAKFRLKNVMNNGCYFIEYDEDDNEKDRVCLTKTAMKALYLLLTTE